MALIGTLTSGVSALQAFSKGMEVIGDNIANANTTAFKSSNTQYADNFANVLRESTPSPTSGNGSNTTTTQVGQGVHVDSILQNFAQGTLNSTGTSTDLGISGNGFFRVRDVANQADFVTRDGSFRIDDQGFLVTDGGQRLQGLADGSAVLTASVVNGALTYSLSSSTAPTTVGDIKVNSDLTIANGGIVNSTGGAFTDAQIESNSPQISSFGVNSTGDVVLKLSNGESYTRGKVLLQNFQDPNALTRQPGNLYSGLQTANPIGGLALSAAGNTPGASGLGTLEQGALELSNVDLTTEFANLINMQRSFQAGSRIITTADSVLEEIVNLKR